MGKIGQLTAGLAVATLSFGVQSGEALAHNGGEDHCDTSDRTEQVSEYGHLAVSGSYGYEDDCETESSDSHHEDDSHELDDHESTTTTTEVVYVEVPTGRTPDYDEEHDSEQEDESDDDETETSNSVHEGEYPNDDESDDEDEDEDYEHEKPEVSYPHSTDAPLPTVTVEPSVPETTPTEDTTKPTDPTVKQEGPKPTEKPKEEENTPNTLPKSGGEPVKAITAGVLLTLAGIKMVRLARRPQTAANPAE